LAGHVAADKRPNPEQVYALVELNALIEKQIRKLPTLEQTAFRHFAINVFSMKESWQELGIPGRHIQVVDIPHATQAGAWITIFA
jgi:DNA-directed RNA polymerase specialized sigma24 family protein